MTSQEYKSLITKIIRNTLNEKFPGLKKDILTTASIKAAIAIHARFYGAQVDGVASPIWRDDLKYQDMYEKCQPTKTAQEMLNE